MIAGRCARALCDVHARHVWPRGAHTSARLLDGDAKDLRSNVLFRMWALLKFTSRAARALCSMRVGLMCAYSLRGSGCAEPSVMTRRSPREGGFKKPEPSSNSKEATVTVQKNLPKRDHAPNAPCAYCWWGRPRASGTLVSRGPAAAMSGGSGRLPTGPPDMRGAPLGAERLACRKCLVFRSEPPPLPHGPPSPRTPLAHYNSCACVRPPFFCLFRAKNAEVIEISTN